MKPIFRNGKSLEFEDALLHTIHSGSAVGTQPKRMAWVAGLLFVTASAALMTGALSRHPSWFTNDKPALSAMATSFLGGLQTNNSEQFLSVCVEGPQSGVLAKREAATALRPAYQASASEDSLSMTREQRLAEFEALRASLTEMGVDWNDIRPVAVGALRSKMRDPDLMTDAITAILGYLYFDSGTKTFAIEVTAWRCGDSYVIVDIWEPRLVEHRGSSLEDAADHELEMLFAQTETAGFALDISRPKTIYVEL